MSAQSLEIKDKGPEPKEQKFPNIPKAVQEEAIKVYGNKIQNIVEEKLSSRAQKYFEKAQFFSIQLQVDQEAEGVNVNPSDFHLVAFQEQKLSLINSKITLLDFMSAQSHPIKDENDLLQAIQVFAEMMKAELQTEVPRQKSMTGHFKSIDPNDWSLEVNRLGENWVCSFTLLMDPSLGYSVRHQIQAKASGRLSYLGQKSVHSHSLYE